MFSNRIFNTAFLISLTWHLICMFAVNIVVLPGKYRMRDLTKVSFLGPILEKTALEIILANKPVAITTSYQRDLRYRHSIDTKQSQPLGNNLKGHLDARAEDNMAAILGRTPDRDKETPDVVMKASGREVYFKTSGDISGPVSHREVIYKPEKPKLPAWVDARSPFTLELEFIVLPQGDVKGIAPVVSSGNPDIDLIGMRYLNSWKFVPLAQESSEEQKGRAKFIFER